MMFVKFKELRTATNFIIINLAFTDIGVAGIGYPMSAASDLHGSWKFGYTGCQVGEGESGLTVSFPKGFWLPGGCICKETGCFSPILIRPMDVSKISLQYKILGSFCRHMRAISGLQGKVFFHRLLSLGECHPHIPEPVQAHHETKPPSTCSDL